MKILVTGADGFIGRNLVCRLSELDCYEIYKFVRKDTLKSLEQLLGMVDFVIHLAGENRPETDNLYHQTNVELTKFICDGLRAKRRKTPIIFASSIHAAGQSSYGKSKLSAEAEVRRLGAENGNDIFIYRLPGVFGKWSRPNYNSVVATFCHNFANNLPIQMSDPSRIISLVYIDDVIDSFISKITEDEVEESISTHVEPVYEVSLSVLASKIEAFKRCRETLLTERVGEGFDRALYATYVSFLPISDVSYAVPVHGDERGIFVEMLKTPDCGQFSFFTAAPNVTRGGHYHHTKTEKFLVLKGRARFGFRNLITQEKINIEAFDCEPTIVETIPGWVHDITNIGEEEMIVMLWANEIFDKNKPDTITSIV